MRIMAVGKEPMTEQRQDGGSMKKFLDELAFGIVTLSSVGVVLFILWVAVFDTNPDDGVACFLARFVVFAAILGWAMSRVMERRR
jgi:hypothetical protein